MTVFLPPSIEAYFNTLNAAEAQVIASLFTPDGYVRDEGATHRGRGAITDWARTSQAKYAVQATPIAATQDGETHVVTARLTGTFPGSPLELTHRFTLTDAGLAALEIGE